VAAKKRRRCRCDALKRSADAADGTTNIFYRQRSKTIASITFSTVMAHLSVITNNID
jgi:hypothetical protein